MRLDYSMASNMQCSTKAWLSMVHDVQMRGYVNEPMQAGSLLHTVLEAFLTGGHPEEVFTKLYGYYFPGGAQQDRYSQKNLWVILQAYMQHYQTVGYPWVVQEVECKFELPFWRRGKDPLTFFGRIDALVRNPDKSLWVMETKTTGYLDDLWSAQWSTSAQLMGYVWAARKLWSEATVRGAYINALEIRELPPTDGNMDKKCRTHGTKYQECQPAHVKHALLGPFVFTDYQLQQWEQTMLYQMARLEVLSAYQDVQHVPMEGIFIYGHKGNLCSSCQFKPFCHVAKRSWDTGVQLFEPRPAY